MEYHLYLLIVFAIAIPSCKGQQRKGCVIDLEKDLTVRHPLILNENGNSFLTPEHNKKGIHLSSYEKVRVVCSGKNNLLELAKTRTNQNELVFTCSEGLFQAIVNGYHLELSFKDIICSKTPESMALETGLCWRQNKQIDIGFITSTAFINLISVCFDVNKKDSLYSVYFLNNQISQRQKNIPRPEFDAGCFFPDAKKCKKLYSKAEQLIAFKKILHSVEEAKKYIKFSGEYYLAKGHMSAMADFLYAPQQIATFYYINAAPQWQVINNGNWKSIEENVRVLASESGRNLMVYSGTWGVTELPDVNNNWQALYILTDNNRLKVPKFFWKVVIDQNSGANVALVTHNNPYLHYDASSRVCNHDTDLCSQLPWLKSLPKFPWAPNDGTKGYSYCCYAVNLATVVPYFNGITFSTRLLK